MTPIPQDLDALQDFLDVHGADPRRWPQDIAPAVATWIAASPAAQAMQTRAMRLEALVEDAAPIAPAFDKSAILDLAARTAQVVPLQPRRDRARAGWGPRLRPLAALAASLILGLIFGASGFMPGDRDAQLTTAWEFASLAADAFAVDDAP